MYVVAACVCAVMDLRKLVGRSVKLVWLIPELTVSQALCKSSPLSSPLFPETFFPTCTWTDLALPSWGLTPDAGEGERSEVSNRPIVLDPEPEP